MKARSIIGGLAIVVASAFGVHHLSSKNKEVKTKKEDYFLVISDPHLHKGLSQKQVGSGVADTGDDLWEITLDKFEEAINGKLNYPKPKFVILLGDLPWHADPSSPFQLDAAHSSVSSVLIDLREIAQKANVPLIYSPGNNDSWGGDYRAFTTDNRTPFMLDSAGVNDWPVINSGACGIDTNSACIADNSQQKLGCYSVYPLGKKGGLKIISLNTVMFSTDNSDSTSWHYYGPAGEQQKDMTAQIDWLKKQFTEGSTTDKILLGMHIPPGKDAYSKSNMWDETLLYNGEPVEKVFLEIVAKHQDRIVGALTSHTHMDGIRKMMYEDNGKLKYSDLVVSIPGITPGHGNNPAMKVFSYDPDNFEWMNFITLYNDFHKTSTVSSTWGKKSFSFIDSYGADSTVKMRDWVAKMDSVALLDSTRNIYTAHGNSWHGNDVAITLEVKP